MSNICYIGFTPDPYVYHVGMTNNNRSPYERWKDYDYRAKLSYVPKKVAFYSIGSLRDEPIHKYILRDEYITSEKENAGIRSDEIFRVNSVILDPVECIKKIVEEAIVFEKTGVRPVDNFYLGRPHQEWANQEILNRFDGSRTIIQPLNMCPRFGKVLQALSLFKDSGLDVMIVAAHWLSANESFISTIDKKFDITSDVAVIKPNYEQFKNAINNHQRVLIDVSLHIDTEKIDTELIGALSDYKKLIYIDEADFGAWTPSSRETANQFIDSGINLVCIATGTNIDRAMIGSKGQIEKPITVSYLDLIEAKRGEGYLFEPGGFCSDDPQKWFIRLSDIVDISVLNLDAGNDLIAELNYLSDERRPNMSKIFAKRNTHIQRKIITRLLVDEDYGTDIFGLYATKYGSVEHPAVMMFIPGTIDDVNNLVKVGKSIAPHYNWIALHGDEHTNRSAEAAVKATIKSGGERTVIISCSMGARSFSVPNIIAVVNCKDGGSVGASVQQASRCLTPGCDKPVGLVVNYSFNTHRTSAFETDLISSAIKQEDLSTDAAIRRVYGLVNFLDKDEEGYLVKLSETDFLEYITSKDNLENMGKATIDIQGLINNINILQLLNGIESRSTTSNEWKSAVKKAKTFIESDGKKVKSEPDKEKKAIRELIRKISSIVDTSANTYYMSPSSTSFQDCLKVIANDPNKNAEYVNLVGIDAEVVLNQIYHFFNPSIMDMIILKAEHFDSMDNFNFSSSDHAINLFDL
jgi:hypothetical protein